MSAGLASDPSRHASLHLQHVDRAHVNLRVRDCHCRMSVPSARRSQKLRLALLLGLAWTVFLSGFAPFARAVTCAHYWSTRARSPRTSPPSSRQGDWSRGAAMFAYPRKESLYIDLKPIQPQVFVMLTGDRAQAPDPLQSLSSQHLGHGFGFRC